MANNKRPFGYRTGCVRDLVFVLLVRDAHNVLFFFGVNERDVWGGKKTTQKRICMYLISVIYTFNIYTYAYCILLLSRFM